MSEINSYNLSKAFFDFCFDNPEKISPNHIAIYFFAIEHCNRLGWQKKFGFPSQMTMDAIGIKKHHTYIRYFSDLVDWGFFKLIQKSKNQYSANIISLNNALPKKGTALGKAISKHGEKQTKSIRQSTGRINKLLNLETNKPINYEQFKIMFLESPTQIESLQRLKKTSLDEVKIKLDEFIDVLSVTNEVKNNYSEFCKHFYYWFKNDGKIEENKKPNPFKNNVF